MPEYQYNVDADERLEWWSFAEDDCTVYGTGDVYLDRVLATSGVFSAEVLA